MLPSILINTLANYQLSSKTETLQIPLYGIRIAYLSAKQIGNFNKKEELAHAILNKAEIAPNPLRVKMRSTIYLLINTQARLSIKKTTPLRGTKPLTVPMETTMEHNEGTIYKLYFPKQAAEHQLEWLRVDDNAVIATLNIIVLEPPKELSPDEKLEAFQVDLTEKRLHEFVSLSHEQAPFNNTNHDYE